MFSGLVQQVGKVSSVGNDRIAVQIEPYDEPFALGESIAINGACLTVIDTGSLTFDVSPETFLRTNLGSLKAGDPVNIERAMRPADRFGGHIVQGHVDCTGQLVAIKPQDSFVQMTWKVHKEEDRYLIDKGSISLNGISLTVVEPNEGWFDTWIIPHTLQHTNLQNLRPGDKVNVEFDMLAKHVEKLLASTKP